jgi:hypothetical protein
MPIKYKFIQSVKEKNKDKINIVSIYELLNIKKTAKDFKEFYFYNKNLEVSRRKLSEADELLNELLKYLAILVNRDFRIDEITNISKIEQKFENLYKEEFSSGFLKFLNKLEKILISKNNLKEITANTPFFQMFFNCVISSKYNEVKKEYFTEEIKNILSEITFPFKYYIKEKIYKEKTLIYRMSGETDNVKFDLYKFLDIFKQRYKITDSISIEKIMLRSNYEVELYKDAELIKKGFREISIIYDGETYIKNTYLLEEDM